MSAQPLNTTAILVAALHSMGASARMVDKTVAELVFDEIHMEPTPGEFRVLFYANGHHIYTMAEPWRAGQTLILRGIELRMTGAAT